jgi:hypothetical protein
MTMPAGRRSYEFCCGFEQLQRRAVDCSSTT